MDMKRILLAAGAAVLAAAGVQAAPPSSVQSPHSEPACRQATGEVSVLLRISGLKDHQGKIRVQLYGDRPDEFLVKGAKLQRIEVPVAQGSVTMVCVPLPKPGNFALAVLHDRNANGKLDIGSDGVGFSRDPKLGLAKPKYRDVMFTARPGMQTMEVVMNYRSGLSVRPVQ